MEKAYDINKLEHKDCSYRDCIILIKNGLSDQYLEPKNIEWKDSEGYICNTWRVVYKEKEGKGMSLEDAKDYIDQRNQEQCFGYTYRDLMSKQFK